MVTPHFDRLASKKEVIAGLSTRETLQTDFPVVTKYFVTVQNKVDITMRFVSRKGEAILNGIQLNKMR